MVGSVHCAQEEGHLGEAEAALEQLVLHVRVVQEVETVEKVANANSLSSKMLASNSSVPSGAPKSLKPLRLVSCPTRLSSISR